MEKKNKKKQAIDIEGTWLFVEAFGYGVDRGIAHFDQENEEIKGYLEYFYYIDGEEPFHIKQYILGEIEDDKFFFGGFHYEILDGEDVEYNLDKWNGDFEENGMISGISFDDGGVTGIFMLYRPEETDILN